MGLSNLNSLVQRNAGLLSIAGTGLNTVGTQLDNESLVNIGQAVSNLATPPATTEAIAPKIANQQAINNQQPNTTGAVTTAVDDKNKKLLIIGGIAVAAVALIFILKKK